MKRNQPKKKRSGASGLVSPAALESATVSIPVDAAAREASRIFPGVLGASRGKIKIQTHSQGIPGTCSAKPPGDHSGNTPHIVDMEIPKAPTTSNTRPASSRVTGRIFANRERRKTPRASAIETIATQVWMARSPLNRSSGGTPSSDSRE